MPVDKFGRRYYRQIQGPVTETSFSEVPLAQMNGILLRRDGTNSAFGTINMSGNTFTNVSNSVEDHDAANKVYVDENAGVSKNGDTMLDNLDMNGYRLTGLSSNLPETDSDAVSWSRAVQLVRDSEQELQKTTQEMFRIENVLKRKGNKAKPPYARVYPLTIQLPSTTAQYLTSNNTVSYWDLHDKVTELIPIDLSFLFCFLLFLLLYLLH